jgi:hypothetical protein
MVYKHYINRIKTYELQFKDSRRARSNNMTMRGLLREVTRGLLRYKYRLNPAVLVIQSVSL